jgi:uncharacterized iron-regulated membrane protein
MGWLILFVLIVGVAALFVRSLSKRQELPRPTSRQPAQPAQPAPQPRLAAEEARVRREVEVETAPVMREVEAEAARMESAIEAEAARIQAEAMRLAAAVAFNGDDSEPVEESRRVVWREDYVAKEDEGRYLSRRADGLPTSTSWTPATG